MIYSSMLDNVVVTSLAALKDYCEMNPNPLLLTGMEEQICREAEAFFQVVGFQEDHPVEALPTKSFVFFPKSACVILMPPSRICRSHLKEELEAENRMARRTADRVSRRNRRF